MSKILSNKTHSFRMKWLRLPYNILNHVHKFCNLRVLYNINVFCDNQRGLKITFIITEQNTTVLDYVILIIVHFNYVFLNDCVFLLEKGTL